MLNFLRARRPRRRPTRYRPEVQDLDERITPALFTSSLFNLGTIYALSPGGPGAVSLFQPATPITTVVPATNYFGTTGGITTFGNSAAFSPVANPGALLQASDLALLTDSQLYTQPAGQFQTTQFYQGGLITSVPGYFGMPSISPPFYQGGSLLNPTNTFNLNLNNNLAPGQIAVTPTGANGTLGLQAGTSNLGAGTFFTNGANALFTNGTNTGITNSLLPSAALTSNAFSNSVIPASVIPSATALSSPVLQSGLFSYSTPISVLNSTSLPMTNFVTATNTVPIQTGATFLPFTGMGLSTGTGFGLGTGLLGFGTGLGF